MDIILKRAYEKPGRTDDFRVLADRLWPRGVKKVDLRVKVSAKEVAPSAELRRSYGHDPKRWSEFRKRYNLELQDPEKGRTIARTVRAAKKAPAITLVLGAKDREHNEAVVLQALSIVLHDPNRISQKAGIQFRDEFIRRTCRAGIYRGQAVSVPMKIFLA